MKTIKAFLFTAILTTGLVPALAQNIERMFQTDVKIYLQQYGGTPPTGPADSLVRPVEREVPNDFKFDYALDALFSEEISEEEEEAGYYSSTYGIKLEGASLKNGIATVRISQPPGNDYEMYNPIVFVDAVTKTARQFRSVKRVKICAVGKMTLKSDLDRPFPVCPATR